MNYFQLSGDLSHYVAIILLLFKIWRSKSCSGISGKSQVLLAVAFTFRSVELFVRYMCIFNIVLKVVFLMLVYATLFLIYVRFRKTYDSENDFFRIELLLIPVTSLTLLMNYEPFSVMETILMFSMFLESVAILPQLAMIIKTGEEKSNITHYLFLLGLYSALYLVSWVLYHNPINIFFSGVQTSIYCEFLWYRSQGNQKEVATENTEKDANGPAPYAAETAPIFVWTVSPDLPSPPQLKEPVEKDATMANGELKLGASI